MITQDGIKEIAMSIQNLISHASVQMYDEEKVIEIYKSFVQDNTLKVYILLDETIMDDISNIKLISKTGKIIMHRTDGVSKDISKGVLLFFSIKILEV